MPGVVYGCSTGYNKGCGVYIYDSERLGPTGNCQVAKILPIKYKKNENFGCAVLPFLSSCPHCFSASVLSQYRLLVW